MKILSLKEVCALTSLSKSYIYARIAAGKFPKPFRLSAQRVGWRADAVAAWLERREKELGTA